MHVQPPPKSPSRSCCSLSAFTDISRVIRAAQKFDLNLVEKLFFLFCFGRTSVIFSVDLTIASMQRHSASVSHTEDKTAPLLRNSSKTIKTVRLP
ncbi:Hypothetical predicted protein [Scomber scombrus]|uniref:Uncharacterized protein n=1 Tax=Scomber scombrus TaxID=13677 RepID=A0AAV1NLW3_SCOSC